MKGDNTMDNFIKTEYVQKDYLGEYTIVKTAYFNSAHIVEVNLEEAYMLVADGTDVKNRFVKLTEYGVRQIRDYLELR